MITVLIVLVLVNIALVIALFLKKSDQSVHFNSLRDELFRNREELTNALDRTNNSLLSRLSENSQMQKNQLDTFTKQLTSLTQINEQRLDQIRDVVQNSLSSLQKENSEKLDKMREVVDEKLQSTLEKRLGESFRLVSDRLEKVQHGLGEMQALASGVGDLKRVLTNVKTRGTWGEIQLGNLLEQILTIDQYERNVITKKGSRDSVEFAVKLPGRDASFVYIPIDAKFPKEDYERLMTAQDQGNALEVEEISKILENRIKAEAKKIKDKYIDPPHTTDFAIMYLPIEGLYAEVLRRQGLCEFLQREYRVSISGPTTIAAFLNSLQMGFRTLAVEKRASEVWSLLGAVRNEFMLFGGILEKTHKKLQEASNTIEEATSKFRNIERKLRNVQQLPQSVSDLSTPETLPVNEANVNETLF